MTVLTLPPQVQQIILTLRGAGYQAFAVGGCVRDLLCGKTPNDYDVTTDALPEAVLELFPHTFATGLRHGTVTVLNDGFAVEVTTFRVEGGYSDRRRPDEVRFVTDVRDDLARRDFTVNAMAYCEETGVVDPFGGREDLKAGILRAVGDPERRFSEDALRILRLFRFAAVLGFVPEEQTRLAALRLSPHLSEISRERIAVELEKAVCGKAPQELSPLLDAGGLSFLGIAPSDRLGLLSRLPDEKDLRMFAFLRLCGGEVDAVLCELRSSNERRRVCETYGKLLAEPIPCDRPAVKRALRLGGKELFPGSLSLREVLYGEATAETGRLAGEILAADEPYRIDQLAVNGELLRGCGITGKKLGDTLVFLLETVTEHPERNKAETLLALAREYAGL